MFSRVSRTAEWLSVAHSVITHFEICVDDENALCVWYRVHDENLEGEAVVADLDNVALCQAGEVPEGLLETADNEEASSAISRK